MIHTSLLKTAMALGATLAITSPVVAQNANSMDAQAEAQPAQPQALAPGAQPSSDASQDPVVATLAPGQVGALQGGAVVSLDQTYRAVGQVFRPASSDPIGQFAFMLEVYDGTVVVTGELLEWDAVLGTGASVWASNDLVERTNERLEPLAFDTGGLVLDPAKDYLILVRIQDSQSEKGAGIGAAYPGEYQEGYMVRQEAEGYKILDSVDATFIILPKLAVDASATSAEPAEQPNPG